MIRFSLDEEQNYNVAELDVIQGHVFALYIPGRSCNIVFQLWLNTLRITQL